MRLLLTSGGITTQSMVSVLKNWVKDIRIVFIPTAANVEDGKKDWLINDLVNCQKLGTVDIVDISAVDKKIWLPRLQKANVMVVGGGNTEYLMKCVVSSGLKDELPRLLKDKVYVGISAGSCVMSKTLNASSEFLYGDESKKEVKGLGYIDFNVRPHLNSPHFPRVRDAILKTVVKKLKGETYALDDNSAIMLDDGKISVISEGKWIKYSEKT